MAGQVRKSFPATKGLYWHRDQYYSFFIPMHWHKLDWPDDRQGVVYAPDLYDPFTVFAVDIKDLRTIITAADLDILAEGFFESIEQLPDCIVEFRDRKVAAKQLELEAKYTYQEQGETRKRWVRTYYHETRQIVMTAQGATPDKYDYWLPWFFEAMMTVKIHNQKPQEEYPV